MNLDFYKKQKSILDRLEIKVQGRKLIHCQKKPQEHLHGHKYIRKNVLIRA